MKTVIRNSYTPKIGDYCNALVIDKETERQYFFDADGVWTLLSGAAGDYYTKEQVDEHIGAEAEAREAEDERIWDKIEDIEMSSDVVDVVGTMADLSNYDTSMLSDNDLIKVLQDNTHGNAISYYRWDTESNQFTYVGSEGPYYTQAQTDALLDEKAAYTIFYASASETGAARHIYKNADMTGEATVQELLDASNAGPVALRLSTAQSPDNYSDSYLQNTLIAPDDQDFEFVFLDDRSAHTYSADETTDSVFDYSKTNVQAELTAGQNITISGTTISATDTDTTYSAGTGLNLNGTTFSIDNTVALKSEIPTATSQLSNDSGFITKDVSDLTNYYKKTETYTQGEVNSLISAITVPTKTSDLQNDSGFLTAAMLPIASANTLGAVKIGSGISVTADGTISAAGGGSSTNYRYDLSWALATPTATQEQIDEVEDAIANGDIIYISIDNEEVIADSTWYSNNNIDVHFTRGWASGDPATYVLEMLHINFDKVQNAIAVGYETPTIATKTSELTNDGSDGTSTYVETDELAAVATSGSYADLSNTPTIPTVNNATLTIQENGSQVATFTANAANNVTANIAVPTKTSDLNNDSGFITDTDYADSSTGGVVKVGSGLSIDANGVLSATGGSGPTYTAGTGIDITSDTISVDNTTVPYFSDLATVATTGDYGDLLNKPTIPAAQVNSDWNATSGVAEILNKPTIPAAQIQSDWAQADTTAVDYIKNKPAIPVVNDAALTITQNGVTAGTFTANSNVGITVALTDTTYSDFVGTDGTTAGTAGLVPAPATADAGEYLKADGTWDTPPGVNYLAGTGIDITGATISVDTSVVAEVSDIPTKTSDLTNDGADGTSTYVEADDLATVATSGSYNDLSNKPTIPAAQVNSDWDANSGVAQILNKPNLATVATSGSYNDLSNKPTIPTVNDATLTIQKNGSTVNTFTANSSSNVTANITVPVNTSDLNNDSGFITATDYADASTGGVVKVGSGLSIDANGVLSATGGSTSRYDASWVLSGGTATQAQYDGLSAAIAAGDIIYASSDGFELLSDYYGDNNGNLSVTFTYTQIVTRDGSPATMVYTMQAFVNGATKAITIGNISTYVPRMSDIPTKTSDLTNDGSDGTSTYIEVDDLPSIFAGVAFTGSYTDLLNTPTIPAAQVQSDWAQSDNTAVDYIKNKPTIPVVNDATLTITQNGTSAGTFSANASSNATIALTDTTYSAFTGATSSVAGAAGLVPAPTTSDPDKFLKGDGTWGTPAGETFDVTISTATGATWTSDKTYAQIVAAVAAGTPFNVRVDFPPMFTAAVNSVHYSPSDGEVYFGMSFDTGNGIITETITIDSSDNITATQETMPTVNNGALTIQHNGTTKGTFTANQSANSTINIETIYADTLAPTSEVGAITTNNIADGAVTSDKIDWATVGDAIYPVNSIVTFYDTVDHSNFLGLTWERVASGKMIVGYDSTDTDFNTIGATGGEKTHILTASEMPSHNHTSLNWTTDTYHCSLDGGSDGNGVRLSYTGATIRYNSSDFRTGYTGSGGAHNNMPPYLVASLWRRTA